MSKVLVKSAKPILVKAPQISYDMSGKPVVVMGGSGGGAGGGRSKRQRVLGGLGALAGAAGGMLGGHRSLGSLAGSVYVGGTQGHQLGEGLGRKITGRKRQATLDAKEQAKQQEAMATGRMRADYANWRGDDNERAPSAWAASRKTGKFKTGRDRENEMRRFLAQKDSGGLYDTPKAQAERAKRDKLHAKFSQHYDPDDPDIDFDSFSNLPPHMQAEQFAIAAQERKNRVRALTDPKQPGTIDTLHPTAQAAVLASTNKPVDGQNETITSQGEEFTDHERTTTGFERINTDNMLSPEDNLSWEELEELNRNAAVMGAAFPGLGGHNG